MNVFLRLLEAVDFVVVAVIIMNIVVVALLVVTGHMMVSCGQ